ncbi:MAG: glycosyl hydrolase, partial [Flavobacteriaceae bacterium]|nr:glycosyl hydrolase [Flavobacteriaceae bacterium]
SNSSKEKLESDKIKNRDYTNYDEGVYVGYRHFDKEKLDVSYPFGYGLSYTSFKFEDSNILLDGDTIKISLKITNTGRYIGKEVIQVYSSISSSKIDRPDKELRTFHKTEKIFPGNSTVVELEIPKNDLSFWSEKSSSWELEPGEYKFHIGSSSRDIRIIESFEIK